MEAALLLREHRPRLFAQRRALELGAGTGLAGLALWSHLRGLRALALTDGDAAAVAQLAERAAEGVAVGGEGGDKGEGEGEGEGGSEGAPPRLADGLSVARLNWGEFVAALAAIERGGGASEREREREREREGGCAIARAVAAGGIDVVLGSDVGYDPDLHAPLCAALEGLLLPRRRRRQVARPPPRCAGLCEGDAAAEADAEEAEAEGAVVAAGADDDAAAADAADNDAEADVLLDFLSDSSISGAEAEAEAEVEVEAGAGAGISCARGPLNFPFLLLATTVRQSTTHAQLSRELRRRHLRALGIGARVAAAAAARGGSALDRGATPDHYAALAPTSALFDAASAATSVSVVVHARTLAAARAAAAERAVRAAREASKGRGE